MSDTPPIFADLLLEFPDGRQYRVDVEQSGWLAQVQPLYEHAARVGLAERKSGRPAVWLAVENGTAPQYISRVIGKIDEAGHHKRRVAGLLCGEQTVWLHRDGLVEVGGEPSWRE